MIGLVTGETGSLDNGFYILLVKAGVFCRAFCGVEGYFGGG